MVLKVWNNQKQGVLIIPHEFDQALTVANRIIVLSGTQSRLESEFTLTNHDKRNTNNIGLNAIMQKIITIITG